MAGQKKTTKKSSKKAAKKRRSKTPKGSAPPAADTSDTPPPPTAASEILGAMRDIKARREAARQAFQEQREAIRKTLAEQRRSAMDFLADFRRTLESEEANMVQVATEQAKAALAALMPPSVRATTEAAPQPQTPAPPPQAPAPPPAPADHAAGPDPVLGPDQKFLTALKLVVIHAADTEKLSKEDAELAESVLLDSLKELARQQAGAHPDGA